MNYGFLEKSLAIGLVIWCMSFTSEPRVGDVIDNLDGIPVFYNGHFTNVSGRNTSYDGYNFGLKYQCVEFVKRFYYLKYNHKMPNSYGHAKDFFDKSLVHGAYNSKRGLYQYKNAHGIAPKVGDIIVYDGCEMSRFGHIAIISQVNGDNIEIIQQNWGKKTRQMIPLVKYESYYTVADFDILGWMRL